MENKKLYCSHYNEKQELIKTEVMPDVLSYQSDYDNFLDESKNKNLSLKAILLKAFILLDSRSLSHMNLRSFEYQLYSGDNRILFIYNKSNKMTNIVSLCATYGTFSFLYENENDKSILATIQEKILEDFYFFEKEKQFEDKDCVIFSGFYAEFLIGLFLSEEEQQDFLLKIRAFWSKTISITFFNMIKGNDNFKEENDFIKKTIDIDLKQKILTISYIFQHLIEGDCFNNELLGKIESLSEESEKLFLENHNLLIAKSGFSDPIEFDEQEYSLRKHIALRLPKKLHNLYFSALSDFKRKEKEGISNIKGLNIDIANFNNLFYDIDKEMATLILKDRSDILSAKININETIKVVELKGELNSYYYLGNVGCIDKNAFYEVVNIDEDEFFALTVQ